MVAFIRGDDGFLTSDEIYVKMLPNGEARRVTDDPRTKYGLAFSPDGAEIAYTVLETSVFSTYEVSVLGGEPHLLLKNAAGLVWLDPQHLLFSEIRPGEGIHLGVVTATMTRSGLRELYFPAHERGMAHDSLSIPGSALGIGGGDGREWRLGAVPADCSRRPEPVASRWTQRRVHLGWVVSGWPMDVFHCLGGRTKPHLAGAFSGGKAGANHLWTNGRGWSGSRAGRTDAHYLGGSA